MVAAPPAGDEEVQAMTEHQRESEWYVADWQGKMLVDCNGGTIGELQDVYVDVEGDEPHRSFLSCAFSPSQSTPANIRCTRQPAAPTPAAGFQGYFFSSGYG
jgi:hypothetical protein